MNAPSAPLSVTSTTRSPMARRGVRMKTGTLFRVIGCSAVLALAGADWPQWRGPDRTDVSRETGLLTAWPEKGPPLAWTSTEIGIGYSGPAVVGNRLYILGTRDRIEHAFALDTNTGKMIWATEIGPTLQWKGNTWGDGPRSTPTVDGD